MSNQSFLLYATVLVFLSRLWTSSPHCLADDGWDSNRLEATVLVSRLLRPMELEVAPDGTVYYIELEGQLKCFSPDTGEATLVGEVPVTTEQENGLIGMALDPDFSDNHWIYLQFSPPDFSGQHICRFTLVDGKLDLDSRRLLYKYEEQRKQCCHHAGSLEFGPDGCLYITAGDNTNPFEDSQGYAPIDERPGRGAWDAQRTSANSKSSNGKILRIRPLPDGTYEIPEGNLFPPDGSQGLPEIYVMGCRNPWRISIDPATGFLYWGDVGPDAGGDSPRGTRGHDEINQAREAGFFGWPYFNGNNRPYADVNFATGEIGDFFDPAKPYNDSPNNEGVRQLPPAQPALIYYPGAASKEFPELASGGRTACAGPVYHFDAELDSETKLPQGMDKALLIFEWSRHWIKLVHFDREGQVERIEPFMPQYPFVRPVDMCFGPEGSLYILEYGETWGVNDDARLIRVDYIRGNRKPTAVVAARNNIGRAPLTVQLSAKGSEDKDQDELRFEWRLIDTAQPDAEPAVVARGMEAEIEVTRTGVFNAELTVTDTAGASRTATVPLLVGNARPSVAFALPHAGDFFDPGELLSYEVLVHDEEDGTNDAEAWEAEDAEVLDPESASRVVVSAWPMQTPPGGGGAEENIPAGLELMKSSDCFNCHAINQARVGPRLLDIAEKYRDQENAQQASVQRVINGSTGVWGKIPMIPHSQHTMQEVQEMVNWIYGLQSQGQPQIKKGFVGKIQTPAAESPASYIRLEANYTDLGSESLPPLNGSAELWLRPRQWEAELADQVNGPSLLNSGRASGGRFVGAINHGHTLRFRDLNFDQIAGLQLSVASAGAGGDIEVRLDQPDGPILGSVKVEVNGDWEDFYQRQLDWNSLDAPPEGRHDLIIRFTHPSGSGGGLMNLDKIEFLKP